MHSFSHFVSNNTRTALATCALLFFGLAAPRAQVAYNFQLPDDIPPVASTDAGYDILTMDCLAANGYGQWTSSTSTTNVNNSPSGFLLSNILNDMPPTPGSPAWDDVQTGVLASKEFTYNGTDVYPTEAIKCAANLRGNVRYVWLDNTSGRNKFYVEGFDPGSAGGGSGIDISFAGLPSNVSIVKDSKANLYVEGVLPHLHTLVTSTNENLYPDMFDIAIDANYLYIVWEEYSSPTYSIYAAAVSLSSSMVTQLGLVAYGRRPTVAVDVRHSGSIADIDVAYILSVPGGVVNWTGYTGSSTIWFSPLPISTAISGSIYPWSSATHARIVDASTAVTASTDKAIYFIADDHNATDALLFNWIVSGAPSASCNYCDGHYNTTRSTNSPIETSAAFPVMDDYIRAFANPYEGATGAGDFEEFHCLYVLNHTSGITGPVGGDYPLMIIPNYYPANGYCVSGDNIHLHPLGRFPYYDPISAAGNEPSLYVGAVNQMGIHTHWIADSLSVNTHYYRRDKREFDQNIEENTLMTDTCVIGNTESGVGTSSPTLLSNLDLTFYSDPATYANPGISVIVSYGWLDFDNEATLNIGSGSYSGSDFAVVGGFYSPVTPVFWGQVPGLALPTTCSTNSWAINFGANNSMDDYYTDVAFLGNGQFTLNGTGETLVTNGTSTGEYVTSITDPINVNIHNTSLNLAPCSGTNTIGFTATDGIFDFLGNDVTDPNFPGTLVTYCNGSFTNCQFRPDASSTYYGYSMCVAGNGTWDGTTGTGDGNYNASYSLAGYHTVTFTSCYGITGIDIEGSNPIAPASVVVSGGEYNNSGIVAGVYFGSPWWPVSISETGFDDMHGQGIIINEGTAPTLALEPPDQLYSILLDNNDFKTFYNGTGYSGFTPYTSGIMIAYAPDVDLDDVLRQDITVTNNVFESAGSEEHGIIDAAIFFMDATGDIGYNQITTGITSDSKYTRGIWNESTLGTYSDWTWSFICSNNVSGLTSGVYGDALYTDYYTGYAKLNSFTNCLYGQASSYNDNGHIDFSTYSNMSIAAYAGYLTSATDLSGVHSSPSASAGDDPGLNLFDDQGIILSNTAIVYLGLEPGTPTWTVYGENSILVPYPGFDIIGTGSTALGDISNNYWSGGSNYRLLDCSASGGYLTSAPTNPGFVCSSGLNTKRKGITTLSSPNSNDTTVNACGTSLSEGYTLESQNIEPEGYDTLRAFLEDCPLYPNSYQAFTMIGGAASQIEGGPGGWSGFLSFLKQVLYYNLDTNWYCNDVGDMLTAEQENEPAKEAICQYILASGKCPALADGFEIIDGSAANGRHTLWLDSIIHTFKPFDPYMNDSINIDTLAHPFSDTAIPSLQQDSLEILLGPQYAGVQQSAPSAIGTQALLSAQIVQNPINNEEIDISYQMGNTALVTMELRDVLGRSVPLTYAKYQLEQPGDHNATIPAPNLPAGTYYLRITTDVGDAITLKVVKE